MLAHPVLFTKRVNHYVKKEGIYSIHYMFFYCSWQLLQQIIIYQHRIYSRNSILFHPILLTNMFCGYGYNEGIYSIHYILYFYY